MILTSIWCFFHVGNTFLSLAFVIGVAMVIQAFGGICAYIGARNEFIKSSWILTEAIASGILGAIVLCNMLTVDAMITIFFSLWCLYSGLHRTVASSHMMWNKESGWLIPLIIGAVTLLFGIYGCFNLVLFALSNITIVTIIMLIQGANTIALAVNMPGKYKIFPHDHSLEDETDKPEPDFTFSKGGTKNFAADDDDEAKGIIKPDSELPAFSFSDVSAKIDDAAVHASEDNTVESIAEDISEIFDEEEAEDDRE